MADQELKLKISEEGSEQTAAKVGKVSGATEQLKDKTEASAAQTTKAAESQENLNAAESD